MPLSATPRHPPCPPPTLTEPGHLPTWWAASASSLAKAPTSHDLIRRGAMTLDIKGVAGRLLERGFVVVDGFLGDPAAAAILTAIRDLDGAGALRLGKLQHGLQQTTSTTSRNDRIAFLPSIQSAGRELTLRALARSTPQGNTSVAALPETSVLRTYVAAMDGVRARLSEHETLKARLGGSLDDCNFMTAIYPGGGARYVRHRDALPYKAGRKITVIYYLNAEWQEGHGGELQIWPTEELEEVPVRVPPIADRLLIFVSSMWHEVLPSWRPRYALTTWMFNRQDTALELLAEDMRQKKAAGKLDVKSLLMALEADSSDDDDQAPSNAGNAGGGAAAEEEDDEGNDRMLNKGAAMSVLMQLLLRKKQHLQNKEMAAAAGGAAASVAE